MLGGSRHRCPGRSQAKRPSSTNPRSNSADPAGQGRRRRTSTRRPRSARSVVSLLSSLLHAETDLLEKTVRLPCSGADRTASHLAANETSGLCRRSCPPRRRDPARNDGGVRCTIGHSNRLHSGCGRYPHFVSSPSPSDAGRSKNTKLNLAPSRQLPEGGCSRSLRQDQAHECRARVPVEIETHLTIAH